MPGAAVHAMIEGLAARLELIDGIPEELDLIRVGPGSEGQRGHPRAVDQQEFRLAVNLYLAGGGCPDHGDLIFGGAEDFRLLGARHGAVEIGRKLRLAPYPAPALAHVQDRRRGREHC